MSEPLQTRIRDTEFGKEGVIIAYTSAGVAVVEWQNGGVSTFTGKYEAVEYPRVYQDPKHGGIVVRDLPQDSYIPPNTLDEWNKR